MTPLGTQPRGTTTSRTTPDLDPDTTANGPVDPAAIPARVSAQFQPGGSAVGAARRLVRESLHAWGVVGVLDDAVLLVSELVTNALVHAGTRAEVVATLLPDAVQIDVVDHYPSRWLPGPPGDVDPEREGGRGLFLLQEMAQEWGVEYARTSKRVWFRLAASPSAGTALATPVADAARLPESPGEVRVAAVTVGGDGRVTGWNEAAVELLGRSADDAVGRPWAAIVGWPETGPAGLTLDDVLALARWQGVYDVRRPGGDVLRVFASHLATSSDGDGSVVCLLVPEEQRSLLAAPSAPAASRTLPGDPDGSELFLSEALTARLGLEELLQRTVERARDGLGAEAAFVLLSTDVEDEVELRGSTGLPTTLPRYSRLPAPTGARGRVDSARLPAVHDLTEDDESLPVLAGTGMRYVVTVPLLVEGQVIGTLGVATSGSRRFTNEDAVRLQRAADRVVLSVQIARLADLDRARRGWLSFLAEASELLAGTLDQDMVLALTAQLVVPRLATWCAVHVADDLGEARLACAWHADESRIDDLRDLLEKSPGPALRATPGARPWVPAAGLDLAGTALAHAADLAADAVVTVPLVARGRALGTLALGTPVEQPLRQEVVELAEDLARRAALALDNARLYSARTAANSALQRSLLPPALPEIEFLEVGVVYQAAGEGNEVGGDFYDVFASADGGWGFAVGDVCGKGAEAAAVTGIARHALRLLAPRGSGIEDTLRALNTAILDEGPRARFVTLVHGVARPSADGTDLELASAGHPLPLLVHADGSVDAVGAEGALLGVLDEVDVEVRRVRLEPGETLVCFTDGVTERRDGSRMLGEDGLAEVLVGCAGLSAAAVAARVHRAVLDYAEEPPRDDMAILVLRAL